MLGRDMYDFGSRGDVAGMDIISQVGERESHSNIDVGERRGKGRESCLHDVGLCVCYLIHDYVMCLGLRNYFHQLSGIPQLCCIREVFTGSRCNLSPFRPPIW